MASCHIIVAVATTIWFIDLAMPMELNFSTIKTTWDEAEQNCVHWGGHIATPLSDAENTALWNEVRNRSIVEVWIGISDRETEGKWVAVQNNKPMNFQKFHPWHHGEPNGGRNENCGMMWDGKWNDISCHGTLYYACAAHVISCPDGCGKGGICVGWNRCKCAPGYEGDKCETEKRFTVRVEVPEDWKKDRGRKELNVPVKKEL